MKNKNCSRLKSIQNYLIIKSFLYIDIKIILFFLLITLTFAGCSFNKIAVGKVSEILNRGITVFEQENDLELLKSALPANIKILETLYLEDPENIELAVNLSKIYFVYSFAFVEEEYWTYLYTDFNKSEKYKLRAKNLYKRGKKYADNILKLNKGFKESFNKSPKEFSKSLKQLSIIELEALFWFGFNWAQYINLSKDNLEELVNIVRVKSIIDRVIELDENHFFGSAHIFLGSYYSSRPEMLGGSKKLSKHHFEKAIKIFEGKFLLSKILYAWHYANQFQDLKLYEKLLNEVLTAPDSVLKGQEFITAISKKIAKRLISQKEEFFDMED